MLKRATCTALVKSFRAKNGVEASDENVIATVHLMNTHGVDVHAALDQSSRSGNDHGIDAWHYDEGNRELFIYQSKLTESRSFALRGFSDLADGREWLEQVIVDGKVDAVPADNHCLFNLYTNVSKMRKSLRRIHFVLLSLFDGMELEDSDEYSTFENDLVKSKLNTFARRQLNFRLAVEAVAFNLDRSVPDKVKTYPIRKIPSSRTDLRQKAHLDLAYVPLHSLLELYRQRGDVLFDKNVRLSLAGNKDARERLVNPMEETLSLITSAKLDASIFPFYHIGVTIAATSVADEDTNLLNLEAPSIINGCQTITIANEFLKRLEKLKNEEAIRLFKQIKVIAKVVVGTSNEELKEITNSNNRQNPIDNWQLFSNEPIHVEIEMGLKEIGVFYERQKGKFDSVMKNTENAKHYDATNGTYVRIVDLGQVIALAKRNLQWGAKPSEIFLNKDNHDRIFDRSIPKYPRDIVFTSNLMKAMKRGLNKYLELPTHANSYSPVVFKKPIVRAYVYHLALLHFYQSRSKVGIRTDFSRALNKIAHPRLVEEAQAFYQRIVSKTRNWYTDESQKLTREISRRRMDSFFSGMATELGVDPEDGAVPFSKSSLQWDAV